MKTLNHIGVLHVEEKQRIATKEKKEDLKKKFSIHQISSKKLIIILLFQRFSILMKCHKPSDFISPTLNPSNYSFKRFFIKTYEI